MEKTIPPLGWALAHLHDQTERTVSDLSTGQQDYMRQMIMRMENLQADGGLHTILKTLPDVSCTIDQPFLHANEDFFLAFFTNAEDTEICQRLSAHLNSCFSCFEIFIEVLRDYYMQRERFSLKNEEGSDES